MTPYEAGLGPFINLDKNDFIGREALIGRDQRSLLLGLTCRTAVPSSENEILYLKKVVEHITSGVPSPTLGIRVGYPRFNKPDE